MKTDVLFIHGAGNCAYEEDELLATSLQKALGPDYKVRYPKMPTEDSSTYADWKAPIETELSRLNEAVVLVGHSVGGSVLLKFLSEGRVSPPVAGLFVMAAPFWERMRFGHGKRRSCPRIWLPGSRASRTSSCIIVATMKSFRSITLPSTPLSFPKRVSGKSRKVDINSPTIWRMSPRI